MDIEALIERLKTASEGNRDLDLEVFNALGRKEQFFWVREEAGIITSNEFGEGAPGNPVFHLEQFTTSLDDALTLVPDGWGVTMHNYLGLQGRAWASVHGRHAATVPRPVGIVARPDFVCAANSLALAVCMAAIQARESAPSESGLLPEQENEE